MIKWMTAIETWFFSRTAMLLMKLNAIVFDVQIKNNGKMIIRMKKAKI